MKVFSVLDRTAEEFGPPFVAKNEGVALRQFRDLMEKTPPMVRGDFSLYCLAGWDPAIGIHDVLVAPEEVSLIDNVLPGKPDLTEVK